MRGAGKHSRVVGGEGDAYGCIRVFGSNFSDLLRKASRDKSGDAAGIVDVFCGTRPDLGCGEARPAAVDAIPDGYPLHFIYSLQVHPPPTKRNYAMKK